MELTFIDASNRKQHADLISQSRRFRYEVFVKQLGWSALARQDGLEIDAFDTDEASEMILQDATGAVVGYQRFLPTTRPHLLSHVYPQLCDGPIPCEPTLYEWTRFATAQTARLREPGFGPTAMTMMIAAVTWALQKGLEAFVCEIYPQQLGQLVFLRFRITMLGPLQPINGEEVVAVRAAFDQRTLDRLQQVTRDNRKMHRRSVVPAVSVSAAEATLSTVETPSDLSLSCRLDCDCGHLAHLHNNVACD